jgi:hypothetical protein
MTKDQCKDLLVDKITYLGGVRADEFVAWRTLYLIEGFAQLFHPEMIQQLAAENRITIIEYTLPGKKPLKFLLPKGTTIKVVNGVVES